MNYIIYLILLIIGFVFGRKTAANFGPRQKEELDDLRDDAHEAVEERTEKRKAGVLAFMKRELEHQKELEDCKPGASEEGVKRSDIEELLGVSAHTARRYLNELEDEGKIKQIGERGPDVYYVLAK